jgi:hypothetical protein
MTIVLKFAERDDELDRLVAAEVEAFQPAMRPHAEPIGDVTTQSRPQPSAAARDYCAPGTAEDDFIELLARLAQPAREQT